jgi:DNA-binding LytR/AlgR family response regulator
MQTHRSWWVAFDAIEKEQRDGRKNLLKLTNGTLVPVSKTYLNQVKATLLNPPVN